MNPFVKTTTWQSLFLFCWTLTSPGGPLIDNNKYCCCCCHCCDLCIFINQLVRHQDSWTIFSCIRLMFVFAYFKHLTSCSRTRGSVWGLNLRYDDACFIAYTVTNIKASSVMSSTAESLHRWEIDSFDRERSWNVSWRWTLSEILKDLKTWCLCLYELTEVSERFKQTRSCWWWLVLFKSRTAVSFTLHFWRTWILWMDHD